MMKKIKDNNIKDKMDLDEEITEQLNKPRTKRLASKGVEKLISNIKDGKDGIPSDDSSSIKDEDIKEEKKYLGKKRLSRESFKSEENKINNKDKYFNEENKKENKKEKDNKNINNKNNNENNNDKINKEKEENNNKDNNNFDNIKEEQNIIKLDNYQESIKIYLKNFFEKTPINCVQILNKINLEKKISNKLKEYNIKKFDLNDKTLLFLNYNLLSIIKTILIRLITISRIRNTSFNNFSKNILPIYNINTYNLDYENNNLINFYPSKNFKIIFTNNLKSKYNLIEEFQKLNNKKIKLENFSKYKEKLESLAKEKGVESTIKFTSGPNLIKLGPGRRTRKKDSAIIKQMRNSFAKNQKKEESNKQKSDKLNTINTIFENKKINSQNSISFLNNDENRDNKNDYSILNNDNNINKNKISFNDVNINIFKHHYIDNSDKYPILTKKKINLKDLIFLLENDIEIFNKNLFLQKIMMKISELNNK